MILHTGLRTDIPAFYSRWLANRFREGQVLVRNPYAPGRITRYRLDPAVVDLVCFCTKNPRPMLGKMDALAGFAQFWFVTVMPYGRDIEPNVPPKEQVLEDFASLSRMLGPQCVQWRYDPILLNDVYTKDRHIDEFAKMASALRGYTDTCVISFVDLYQKVRRNFPQCREVPGEERTCLAREMARIATENGMRLKSCAEGDDLAVYGVDTRGCMTIETYERAIGAEIHAPKGSAARKECACYLGADIGMYDTCGHMCRYCYANTSAAAVQRNLCAHDPMSPLLCGNIGPQDIIADAKQESWIERQIRMQL